MPVAAVTGLFMTAYSAGPFEAVIFDLEFTAWAGSMARRWLGPGEFKEVVQFGAVKIDSASLAVKDELEILVRPRLNPVLSDYLVALTGITNDAIAARGVDFAEGYARFYAFCADAPSFAFGRDDLVLRDNLRLYGLRDAPPLPPYTNVIEWLSEHGVDASGLHACDVAGICGASFAGRKHDALEDARSVALGMKTLISRGARNPFPRDRPSAGSGETYR
jgi:inhibitor of KinA sporulation pathway (predicted exonuclease)